MAGQAEAQNCQAEGEEESQEIMELVEVVEDVATWRLGRAGDVGEDWREADSVDDVDQLLRVADDNIATFQYRLHLSSLPACCQLKGHLWKGLQQSEYSLCLPLLLELSLFILTDDEH